MLKGKYDAEDFWIPETDCNGKFKRIWCRAPSLMQTAIDQVFSSGKFPFELPGDLIRWAIHRGLEELLELEPVPSSMPILGIIIITMRMNLQNQRFQEFFTSLERVVLGILSSGNAKDAQALLAAIHQLIMVMPSGFWRTKCLMEFRKQWGHMLIQGSPAGAESKTTSTPIFFEEKSS